eukprot:Selendium_serpulae@DN5816_c0_g1_i5.p1
MAHHLSGNSGATQGPHQMAELNPQIANAPHLMGQGQLMGQSINHVQASYLGASMGQVPAGAGLPVQPGDGEPPRRRIRLSSSGDPASGQNVMGPNAQLDVPVPLSRRANKDGQGVTSGGRGGRGKRKKGVK